MTTKDALIEKLKEYNAFLGKIVDDNAVYLAIHRMGARQEDIDKGKRLRSEISDLENEVEAEVPEEKEKYKPYFGWCDVSGCKNEGCSGGIAWNKTGYWTVCYKHSASHRKGDVQPKMKRAAIKREKNRNKITGYLPIKN